MNCSQSQIVPRINIMVFYGESGEWGVQNHFGRQEENIGSSMLYSMSEKDLRSSDLSS